MGAVFKGEGEDKPRLKLWYSGKEVLINKVFDSIHKVKGSYHFVYRNSETPVYNGPLTVGPLSLCAL